MSRLDNRAVLAGVAGAAAIATAHGGFEAARSGGAPWPVALLYPLMSDLLAVGAWRETQQRGASKRRKFFAWAVVVVAAGASGVAQAYVLAHEKQGGEAQLAAGVGAFPAVAVLVATILTALSDRSEPAVSVDLAAELRDEIRAVREDVPAPVDLTPVLREHKAEMGRYVQGVIEATERDHYRERAAERDTLLTEVRREVQRVGTTAERAAVEAAERAAREAAAEAVRTARPVPVPRPAGTGTPARVPTGAPGSTGTGSKRSRGEAAYRRLIVAGTNPADITGAVLAREVEGPDATDATGYYRGIIRDLRAAAVDTRPDADVLPLDRAGGRV